MGKISKKVRDALAEKAKSNTNNSGVAANISNPQSAVTAEQQTLKDATAIADNGRTTQAINNTTNIPSNTVTSDDDDLTLYINNTKNRKKRGAPMNNMQGVLGQPTILGV